MQKHKMWAIFAALVIIGGAYYFFGKSGTAQTRYINAQVRRGTLIVSISGSGQVSASNQVDVKPKVSGEIVSIAVSEGQNVKAGTLIARIDSRDTEKAIRDAQTNLQGAQISLEKLEQPADALSMAQAENAVVEAQQSKQNAQDDMTKAYDDGFNEVANAFLDLPGVITGVYDILRGKTVNASQDNIDAYYDLIKNYKQNADQFRDTALNSYDAARAAYDKNLQDYKNASRYSDGAAIDSLINETYNTTKSISEAIKNSKSLLDLVNDTFTSSSQKIKPPTALSAHETSLQTYTGTTNTHLGSLLSIKNTIKNDKDTISNADRTITEKTEALAKLKAGADPLDVQSQELTIQQRRNALLDAQGALTDYYIRAPFDGAVAKLNIKKGDSASPGTAAVTVVTSQRIAEISLNEVDVAKVKLKQKATLTFDAIPNLSITGEVAQIDTIGTVAQGVVTYNVKIGFDTQDIRVKPGMSVSAAIITDVKQNVLLAPNSAVKQKNDTSYVEIFIVENQTPRQQIVQVGLSNDTMAEITSGLNEGDRVVTQTIAFNSAAQSSQNTGLRIPGINAGGGGLRGGGGQSR